jgi:hypothetical protein
LAISPLSADRFPDAAKLNFQPPGVRCGGFARVDGRGPSLKASPLFLEALAVLLIRPLTHVRETRIAVIWIPEVGAIMAPTSPFINP